MDNVVNINLNIPRSDVHFLSELVKKMGWGMTQSQTVSSSMKDKVKLAQRLYGCIQLPEDFDYKKEVASVLSDKYRLCPMELSLPRSVTMQLMGEGPLYLGCTR